MKHETDARLKQESELKASIASLEERLAAEQKGRADDKALAEKNAKDADDTLKKTEAKYQKELEKLEQGVAAIASGRGRLEQLKVRGFLSPLISPYRIHFLLSGTS